MKRVMITGAGGFIGRQTLAPFQAAGFEVHAASLAIPKDAPSGIHWYSHNLLNDAEVNELFSTALPAFLLHLLSKGCTKHSQLQAKHLAPLCRYHTA